MVQFGLVISDVAARETCIKETATQLNLGHFGVLGGWSRQPGLSLFKMSQFIVWNKNPFV